MHKPITISIIKFEHASNNPNFTHVNLRDHPRATCTFYLCLTVCLVCSDPGAPLLGVVGIAASLMLMIYTLDWD